MSKRLLPLIVIAIAIILFIVYQILLIGWEIGIIL